MVGFGTLTPYAGWAATGLPVDPARGLVLIAFCPLFAALYPLTQIYQLEEDTRRGDRTLACVLGVRRSLDAAAAAAGHRLRLVRRRPASRRAGGWRPTAALGWPVLALALALGSWCCCPGAGMRRRLDAADHQRGMYRALAAWAVTDLAVLVASGR